MTDCVDAVDIHYIDFLTDTYNRQYLNVIKQKIKNNELKTFVLIIYDIEKFRNINNSLGIEAGDNLLVLVAERIKDTLDAFFNSKYLIIRSSGDAFMVIIEEEVPQEQLDLVIKKSYKLLTSLYVILDKQASLRVNIAIARFPEDTKCFKELKKFASLALEKAKKSKENIVYFNKKQLAEIQKNLELEVELKEAIKNDEFYIVFQPQIKMNKGLYAIEALARWNHKEKGFITPEKFISFAEKINIIDELGLLLMKKTFCEYNKILKEISNTLFLSINISLKQFMSPNFIKILKREADLYDINPTHITLELTESLFINDLQELNDIFKNIKKLGFKISLDDFGTGYSSLSLLSNLNIDELKIDKSFIFKILENEKDYILTETIINIANGLNIQVVCEGVETKAQLDKLSLMFDGIIQGYYFSKPVSTDKLLAQANKTYSKGNINGNA